MGWGKIIRNGICPEVSKGVYSAHPVTSPQDESHELALSIPMEWMQDEGRDLIEPIPKQGIGSRIAGGKGKF